MFSQIQTIFGALSDRSMREHMVRSIESQRRTPSAECPCCGYKGSFESFGLQLRLRANCPNCESKERHRLFALAIKEAFIDFSECEVLHFAPEQVVYEMIKNAGARNILTADITPGRADVVQNIEELSLNSSSVHRVVCSHVLEHVDDRKALGELFRVLKPGGYAVIMVPMIEGWATTFEEPSIETEADRERYFGQNDHVRYYGSDFRSRVHHAGFDLDEFCADGWQSPKFALLRGEKVFRARRPIA